MDRRGLRALVIAGALLWAPRAGAGLLNDVPSCYAANRIAPAKTEGYSRLIYVLVDQTVGWSPELEQSALDNLNANLQPGTKFVIAEFSAFNQGRYLQVLHTGIIESPMPQAQVNNTAIQKTKIFDACLADQLPFAVRLADQSLVAALQGSTSSLDHSDIMSALQAVSGSIAGDPARQKLLFLASDGLENSSVASFYHHGGMRNIDPDAEIRRAGLAGLFGNFGGAKVFVVGGALPGPGDAAGYREPQSLLHLEYFWQLYFEKSNAALVEFGAPALLTPVGF